MKGFLRLRVHLLLPVPGSSGSTRYLLPGKEILKSLHTRDRQHAKEAAADWYCRTSRVFHLCRLKALPEGQLQDIIQAEFFPVGKAAPQSSSPLLRTVFDAYIQEHKVNWREKSYDEVTYSLGLACEVIGNIPSSDLSTDIIKSYLATLLQLPANHRKSPKYRELSIQEILSLEGITPMSRKSVCKHFQWLGAALKHAKMDHLLDGVVLPTLTRNPYEERSVYVVEDLQRLLDHLRWDEEHPDRFWVPLVGLLQGMRLNEVCQLHVDDVSYMGCRTSRSMTKRRSRSRTSTATEGYPYTLSSLISALSTSLQR